VRIAAHRVLEVLACAVISFAVIPPRVAAAQSSTGSWTQNGVPAETVPTNDALAVVPVADGVGGMFAVWQARPTGTTANEIRCAHLLANGTLDPRWPAGGRRVGFDPGSLAAVSDGLGGVYIAITDSSVPGTIFVVRLLDSGDPAPGWTMAGVYIGAYGTFVSLQTTSDHSVWGVFGFTFVNCPIGEPYCDNDVEVGARRVSSAGADITGPFPGGFFIAHAGNSITRIMGASSPGGVAVYYEVGSAGGYNRYVAAPPLYGAEQWTQVGSGPTQDNSMYLAVDPGGAALTTEGSYSTSILKRTFGPAWPAPWTFPLGSFGGAYPLDVIANPDGSILDHSMMLETNPTPHIVDSYVQHVLQNGSTDPAWPPQGVSTRGPGLVYQAHRVLSGDGQGGCLAVWEDTRTGEPDIYALVILRTGQLPPGWALSGVAVCRIDSSPQTLPRATYDGLGNLFVAWVDGRNGAKDVYAQKIGADYPVPTLVERASGSWNGKAVDLEWQLTASSGGPFVIERSVDGIEWSNIGTVEELGRDAWRGSDPAPLRPGPDRYRLRGPSGVLAGADVVVAISADAVLRVLGVAPNPSDRELELKLVASVPGSIEASLYDLQGRLRATRTEVVPAGTQSLRLVETAKLPAGVYIVTLRQLDAVRSFRVVVTH
jgi:hypothetical protein